MPIKNTAAIGIVTLLFMLTCPLVFPREGTADGSQAGRALRNRVIEFVFVAETPPGNTIMRPRARALDGVDPVVRRIHNTHGRLAPGPFRPTSPPPPPPPPAVVVSEVFCSRFFIVFLRLCSCRSLNIGSARALRVPGGRPISLPPSSEIQQQERVTHHSRFAQQFALVRLQSFHEPSHVHVPCAFSAPRIRRSACAPPTRLRPARASAPPVSPARPCAGSSTPAPAGHLAAPASSATAPISPGGTARAADPARTHTIRRSSNG